MKTNFCILVILLLQLPTSSGLELLTPTKTETVLVGSSVIVPCVFSLQSQQVNTDLLHVKWIFAEKVLLTFSRNETTSYGRATLNTQAVTNGDVSLLLYNLTVEDKGTYTCSVEFNGTKKLKDVSLSILASPSVEITRSSTKSNDVTHINCMVKGFYPRDINVTWYRNGTIINNDVVMGEPQRDENGTFNVNSTLTINPTKMQKNDVTECQVEHISLGKPIKEYFTTTQLESKNSIALVSISSTITVIVMALCCALYWALCYRRKSKSKVSDEKFIIAAGEYEAKKTHCLRMGEIIVPPLVHGKKARLECTICGYSPQNLEVRWLWVGSMDRHVSLVSSNEKWTLNVEETRQENQTYTCTASLTIDVSVCDEHSAEYICQVTHPSLERPLERRTGNLKVIASPVINVMYEVSNSGVYLVTEFKSVHPYPVNLTWSRLKKDKYVNYDFSVLEDEWHINTDGTFDLTSKLKDKRRLIIESTKYFKLTITHESLESPIEKMILREGGVYYLLTEDQITPLPEAPKEKGLVCVVWIPRKITPLR